MNVFNPMPSNVAPAADMGMVWMGSGQSSNDSNGVSMGLLNAETNDMLSEQENIFYTPSHNSMSNQSLEDVHVVHSSHLGSMDNYMHYMDVKNESNDSSYVEDDNSQPVYMITTATQTLPCPTRKIKPIKHPGLVLKTPIAYQGNTDPSVIPIQKDGIAICEKCGAIGVKHAFYTRERRFCSMACARGYNGLITEALPNQTIPDAKQYARCRFSMDLSDELGNTFIDHMPQLAIQEALPFDMETVPLIRRKTSELTNSYDWDSQLIDEMFVAAPVNCFKHVPMSEVWDNVLVGMKVEVENTDCDNISEAFPDSFWVATVMRIIGYKALLRYEGFGSNNSKDFWVSLCTNQVHPVGWCALRGKPLIPPRTIEEKYNDWKDFLSKRLSGARTLPSNYGNRVNDSIRSRFDVGMNLEVVDKNRISQVKVAIVNKIIGKRLNVKYHDLPTDDAGFWCHEDSPLLHPIGWAKKVNHNLMAPLNYLERLNQGIYDEDDATEELFTPFQVGSLEHNQSGFRIGMKLEAIDPLNLSSICAATVMNVLNYGYIMIRIDRYNVDATGADWFCYHIKSPCIFPVGFCKRYNIPLTPPKGYDPATFQWSVYLAETHSVAANPSLFNTYVPLHGFMPGMKIEAADLMDPRLVCVATIAKVAGRLLKIRFDGWEEEYDQWLDCESPDIYPVGWCHSFGHKLEGPPENHKTANVPKPPKVKKRTRKRRGKNPQVTSELQPMPNNLLQKIKTEEDCSPEETSLVVVKEEITEEHHGPEAGQEPVGPDQSLPLSSEIAVDNASTKVIPRLVDNSGNGEMAGDLCPEEWNVSDVAQFLRVNDCANYCDSFSKQNIDGKMLLNFSKEDILKFTEGKVGPSLKIYDLVQQLKMKVNPSQLRHMKANIKKFL